MNLDTTVRRATNVKFEVDSSNEVIVYTDKGRFNAGHSSLRILERCFTPCSVRNLLEEMVDPDKREASKEILRTLKVLFSSGAIVESEGSGLSSSMFPFGGYAAPFVQTKMLNDVLRKQIYLDAIRDLVKPEDIVIDLGTGSGIMSIAAAKAGAKRVYAIEPSGAFYCAKENFRINHVDGVVCSLKGWSTDVDLPEKGTLLLTDLLGNDPFDLSIWELMSDLKKRAMASSCRLLPEKIELRARLLSVPENVLDQHLISERVLSKWQREYGIDFSGMRERRDSSRGWLEKPLIVDSWEKSADNFLIGSINLRDDPHGFCYRVEIPVSRGCWNGILIYYRAQIGNRWFSTDCPEGSRFSHWYNAIWTIPERARSSDRLSVEYRYLGDGESCVSVSSASGGRN